MRGEIVDGVDSFTIWEVAGVSLPFRLQHCGETLYFAPSKAEAMRVLHKERMRLMKPPKERT